MADMAGSQDNNENHANDDEEDNNHSDFCDLDMNPDDMTVEQRKIWDRRMTVDKLIPYKTEIEIAEETGAGLRTVERDVQWLKKEVYRRRVDDLAENGFSFDLLKTKRRLEDKLRKMHRMEEQMGGTNGQDPSVVELENLIPLWKMQNDTESLLNNIVGEGPTLQGMKKAVEKSAN